MTDSNEKPQTEPQVPPGETNDRPPARAVTIPRPSEVRPLNALSSTPPPLDVEDAETPGGWLVDDDLSDDEPTHNQARLSSPPDSASSKPAPLGVRSRFSTAPPMTLSSRAASSTTRAGEATERDAATTEVPASTPSNPGSAEVDGRHSDAPSTAPSSDASSTLGPRSTPLPSSRPSLPSRTGSSVPAPSLPAPLSRPALAPRKLSSPALTKSGLSRAPAPSLTVGGSSSLPPGPPAQALECAAASRLEQSKQTRAWVGRAAAFENQAASLRDPQKKSRLLVVASELYAMAGQVSLARAAAEKAGKLGNHLGHRQARQLAEVATDSKAAAAHFALEASTAPTAQARRHSLVAHAQFERWQRRDPLAASRLLEQVSRVRPTDPIADLMKLGRALGQGDKLSNFTWSAGVEERALTEASESVRRLRGATDTKNKTTGGIAAFLEAQRALERRDRVAAASALLELRSEPGFGRAAAWLASALLAPTAGTRRRAVEILNELDEERSSKATRRTLLARALELGDRDAVRRALASDATKELSDRAFTSLDELVLGVLCADAPAAPNRETVDGEAETADQPLRAAVALRAGRPELAGAIGNTSSEVVILAHRLGLNVLPGEVLDSPDPHPLFLLSRLGQSLADESSAPRPEDVMEAGQLFTQDLQGPLAFTAAALAETLGDSQRAQQFLALTTMDPLCGEAALRASSTNSDASSSALEELAGQLEDGERRAETLVQAALATQNPERQRTLAALAHAAAPDHVLVEATIFRLIAETPAPPADASQPPASTREGAAPSPAPLHAKRLAILSHQSITGENEYLRALALLRHVFNKPSSNTRPTLLSHAWDLWPRDLALLELRERVSPLALEVRARARETLCASVVGPRTRAVLRTEAALFYELAGLPSAAARVAQPDDSRSDLLDGCFGRNAPGTEFAAAWRQKVLERAQGNGSPVERSHHWLQAARLASDAGDWAAERDAVGRAAQLDPTNLEALLTAEGLAFKDGELERIAEVERLLTEALDSPDHLAHAQLASRFLQLCAGGTSGYPALRACVDDNRTPPDVARRLAYMAPRVGEDELGYRMFALLLSLTPRTGDKVLLLLRCAELAKRLGRAGTALTHLEDALTLQPDNLTALSLRAEILSDDYPAAAAEAYERLANVSQSAELRSAAYMQAAEQLLLENAPPGVSVDGDARARVPADPHRVRLNLERALEASPQDEGVLEMLVAQYVLLRLDGELGELFLRLIDGATAETQQALMLRWSQACAEMGSKDRAFELVRDVLERHPESPRALEQLATLTSDAAEREQALLQLVRIAPQPDQQASAYRRLGEHYATSSPPQRTRAVKCYQEAWRRRPDDMECFRLLVDAQIDNDNLAGATATIDGLEQRAQRDIEQHAVAIARAAVDGARNPALGESKLDELFDQRPYDGAVLTELSQLYLRQGSLEKLSTLEERVRRHAERELPSGPHVTQYLSGLGALAKLKGDPSAAALVGALGNLYHRTPAGLDPRGSRAMSRALDTLLAPSPLGEPLRSLLARTCDALEEAFPLNVADLDPRPLDDPRLRASFEMKAKAVGLATPELFVVSGPSYLCHVTHRSSRVLLGAGWLEDAPASLQDFVVWRALKLLQTRLGVLAGLSPEAAALRLDALLSAYAEPDERLVGRVENSRGHRSILHPLLPKDESLGPLARTSIETIVDSSLEVTEAIELWMDRCIVLATGEPGFALRARCLMAGTDPATLPGGLMQAVGQQPAARRLLTSLIDAGFVEAHRSIH